MARIISAALAIVSIDAIVVNTVPTVPTPPQRARDQSVPGTTYQTDGTGRVTEPPAAGAVAGDTVAHVVGSLPPVPESTSIADALGKAINDSLSPLEREIEHGAKDPTATGSMNTHPVNPGSSLEGTGEHNNR
eukprot:gene980-1156_t